MAILTAALAILALPQSPVLPPVPKFATVLGVTVGVDRMEKLVEAFRKYFDGKVPKKGPKGKEAEWCLPDLNAVPYYERASTSNPILLYFYLLPVSPKDPRKEPPLNGPGWKHSFPPPEALGWLHGLRIGMPFDAALTRVKASFGPPSKTEIDAQLPEYPRTIWESDGYLLELTSEKGRLEALSVRMPQPISAYDWDRRVPSVSEEEGPKETVVTGPRMIRQGTNPGAEWLEKLDGKRISTETKLGSGETLRDRVKRDFRDAEGLEWESLIIGEVAVWRLDFGYVVFRVNSAIFTPSASSASAYRYDLNGKPAGVESFLLGWRSHLRDWQTIKVDGISDFLIDIHMDPSINGSAPRRQVYGFDGDRLVLIRAEDATGLVQPIIFESPNHTLGPPIGAKTKRDFLQVLTGSNPIKTLSILTWLGGEHLVPSEHYNSTYHEDMAESLLYWSVVNDPETRAACTRLATSPNKWIAQAAKATKPQIRIVSDRKVVPRKVTAKLLIEDIKKGDGKQSEPHWMTLKAGDVAKFSYTCHLPDGTKLPCESPHEKYETVVGDPQLLDGLNRGLVGMRAGGVRKITIPAALAFGSVGTANVPPDCDIIYIVTLHHSKRPRLPRK